MAGLGKELRHIYLVVGDDEMRVLAGDERDVAQQYANDGAVVLQYGYFDLLRKETEA